MSNDKFSVSNAALPGIPAIDASAWATKLQDLYFKNPSMFDVETMQKALAASQPQRSRFLQVYADPQTGNITPLGMIMMRLTNGKNPVQGEKANWYGLVEIIDARRILDTYYVTASVDGKKPIIIEDSAELFPSDTLITKFHTLGSK